MLGPQNPAAMLQQVCNVDKNLQRRGSVAFIAVLLSSCPGLANSLPSKDIGGPSIRYETLFKALSNADHGQSSNIIRQIKSGEDVQSILQSFGMLGISMPDLIHSTSPTGLERNFARQDQTFGVFKGTEMGATHASAAPESGFKEGQTVLPWTTVTQDTELIEHLLTLYFSWQHSFFQSFPERLFRSDMAAGRTKYCSSTLVNAICAAGCFLSSRSETWQDKGDGKTLMHTFLEETERLLAQVTESTITTVASMGLASYVAGTLVSNGIRLVTSWLWLTLSCIGSFERPLDVLGKMLAHGARHQPPPSQDHQNSRQR